MRTILLILAMAVSPVAGHCISDAGQKALRNVQRSMDIIDAAWSSSIKGHAYNLYLADSYNTQTGVASGPSDVWPYTSAIEAHCSVLEALEAVKDMAPAMYAEKSEYYKSHLRQLIDNLEYYRGTYRLSSYATSNREWSPFAVPRAKVRGTADVSGILNVYDDQMWLSRELIRAYRLTGEKKYLDEAAYLADYVLDGWDCWRDETGEEYGGITWGPGYNSKHACSNAPIIQPLVWLADIYKDTDECLDYYYRDKDNNVVKEVRLRGEHYLDFARKVYDWQKKHLHHESGVFWDMMGADGLIRVLDGYRQHVECGGATGNFYSYNVGTMISGASELFRFTGEPVYKDDLSDASKASMKQFARYVRKYNTYEFITDATAENGFNSWFNNVLMRSYVDAAPFADNTTPQNALNSFQTNLDYAFENHNRENLLPVHLLDGWGDEVVTKAFHQFSFASEYAMLAVWQIAKDGNQSAIGNVQSSLVGEHADVYTVSGIRIGALSSVRDSLSKGIYIVGSRKTVIGG